MQFKIIETKELPNRLVVNVEINAEIHSFGFSLKTKNIDINTNEPIFYNKLKNRIKDLFEEKPKPKKLKASCFKDVILDTSSCVSDSIASLRNAKKLRDIERKNKPKIIIDDSSTMIELDNKRKEKRPILKKEPIKYMKITGKIKNEIIEEV
jgi:hypothetical protein